MILKSFSKIYLSLSVNRKLNNGLHNIQSYFCLINLFDQIEIRKIRNSRDIVKFHGKFGNNIKKTNNSILDTLKILREENVISNYYSVLIKKRIPVFAGLGGGTSNAACIVKFLIKRNSLLGNLLLIPTISKFNYSL